MELPIALQALQFAISGAAGLGLGLIYDLLRALRRRNRRLAVPLDLLFCLVALLLVLLLALYPGQGVVRLFMLGGMALGILLWFLTASWPFLSILDKLLTLLGRTLGLLLAPLVKTCKFMKKFLKKLFLFVEKRSNISSVVYPLLRRSKGQTGGTRNAVSQVISDTQIHHSDCGGVLYRYPGLSAVSDFGEEGGSRGSDSGHRRNRAGESAVGGRDRQCRHRRRHHRDRP
ncbi:MAG: hypothetical protein KH420_07180 [Clostridiales bacterium]|nr:hypothetical protein [Clostridiales bacterium]